MQATRPLRRATHPLLRSLITMCLVLFVGCTLCGCEAIRGLLGDDGSDGVAPVEDAPGSVE